MEAFYWTPPTAEQLNTWGLKASDFPEPNVGVWEELWDVMMLYVTYATQWRVGAGGAVGLDFNVFHHALDRKGITGDEYDEFISDLREIENAAKLAMEKA